MVKLAKISAKTEAFLIVVAAAWPLGWAGRVPCSLVPDLVVDKTMIAGDPNKKVPRYLVGVESLESLAGRRSALRPLLGEAPRLDAISGERDRLLEDLNRSCLGESDRDLGD